MDLGLNHAQPEIMHIDLNSAFATIEQQANPFLRGKPVAITNRLTRGATIIAASHEAKLRGIGVGTKMAEARLLAPDVVVLETDPPKYIHAYKTFLSIIQSYSPDAYMKSVDEGAIDFSTTRLLHQQPLPEIGEEIKARLKKELGEWVTCNIGIAPSRWLAKVAASLHKPDGLDVITARNLLDVYDSLELTNLFGINRRYAARLKIHGINNPLQFLAAEERFLRRTVFHSVTGYYWFLRLRGWEVDSAQSTTKSVGKQYVLHEWTNDDTKLAKIVMKMCEMLGRRLRSKNLAGRGIHLSCLFLDHKTFKASHKFKAPLFTTQDLYDAAWSLLQNRNYPEAVKLLSITCYDLTPADYGQVSLFATDMGKSWDLMRVIDGVNDRYGEFSVMPASMIGTEGWVPDKIPFGSTRHF